MKSLSKQALADWDEFAGKAELLWEEVAAAHCDLANAVSAFNNFIDESDAASMVESWAFDVELYTSERSEAWLEGERGRAFQEWHTALSDLAGQIVAVAEPDEPSTPEWLGADLPFEPEL